MCECNKASTKTSSSSSSSVKNPRLKWNNCHFFIFIKNILSVSYFPPWARSKFRNKNQTLKKHTKKTRSPPKNFFSHSPRFVFFLLALNPSKKKLSLVFFTKKKKDISAFLFFQIASRQCTINNSLCFEMYKFCLDTCI